MPDARGSLAEVWDRFRQSGVADDLAIIEHVAAVLVRMRGLSPARAELPWPETYPGKDLDDTAREEVERLVADAVAAVETDNPEAHVLDPLALFRPTRVGAPGQYPTPRHIVQLMHRLAGVRPRHDLLDLACGSGGLLAHRYADEPVGATVGVEIALRWARIAAANAALRLPSGNAVILQQNALAALRDVPEVRERQFDRVLMNPPFGGKMERRLLEKLREGLSGRSESVLSTLALDALREGGRAALLLPAGPLFSNGSAETALREQMLTQDYHLHAVVALPRDGFQPYSGTQTYLLLLDRVRVEAGHTWMWRLAHDGYPAGQSRDLTGKREDLDDFPLLEAALGVARPTVEIDPGAYGDLLASVGHVTGVVEGAKATEGVVVHAHPGTVLEFAEWHPPVPRKEDDPEAGFVLLVGLSFDDTVRTLVLSPGAQRVREVDAEAWRSDRYPERKKAARGPEAAEATGPEVMVVDVRGRDDERLSGAAFAVTAQGVLLGRTVPTRVVRASLDPRPEPYLARARGSEVTASSAELLRDIRRHQAEAARHLDALSDSAGAVPRADTRPVPFGAAGDAELGVFGQLSARQRRVYDVVRGWPTRTVTEENEDPYEVVVPFTADHIARTLDEQDETGEEPAKRVPRAVVHGTLQILDSLGIIVRAHLPESEQGPPLPYYRLATRLDAPAATGAPGAPAPADEP